MEAYEYAGARTVAIWHLGDGAVLGTGAVISSRGLVVTAAHTLAAASCGDLKVVLGGDVAWDVEEVVPCGGDVAMLTLEDVTTPLDYFVLDSYRPGLGQQVLVFGYPERLAGGEYYRVGSVAAGEVCPPGERDEPVLMGLQPRGTLTPGLSGSPVMDLDTLRLAGLCIGYGTAPGPPTLAPSGNRVLAVPTDRLDDLFVPTEVVVSRSVDVREAAVVMTKQAHADRTREILESFRLCGLDVRSVPISTDGRHAAVGALRTGLFEVNHLGFALDESMAEEAESPNDVLQRVEESSGVRFDRAIFTYEEPSCPSFADGELPHNATLIAQQDLLPHVFDVTDYLSRLVEDFDREELKATRLAVPGMLLEEDGRRDIDDVAAWLSGEIGQQQAQLKVVILGSFGAGKTTLMKRTNYDLATTHLSGVEDAPVPLYLALSEARGDSVTTLVENLVTSRLGMPRDSDGNLDLLGQVGRPIWLLDGLDEMGQTGPANAPYDDVRRVLDAVPADQAMVVTSRVEFFSEEDDLGTILEIESIMKRSSDGNLKMVILRDMEGDDIVEFLAASLSLSADLVREELDDRHELREVCRRPVLLEMVARSLPDLMSSQSDISMASVYRAYARDVLHRDVRLGNTSFETDSRFALLDEIALTMNRDGTLSLSQDIIARVVAKSLEVNLNNAYFYMRDFVHHSLLVRNATQNSYEFMHKSFYEFFLGTSFAEVMRSGNLAGLLDAGFGDRRLNLEVLRFLDDQLGPGVDVTRLFREAVMDDLAAVGFASGNLATLLNIRGQSLAGWDLRGASIRGASFAEMDMSNATLENGTLYDCGFVGAVLHNADFRDTRVKRCDFKSSSTVVDLSVDFGGGCVVSAHYAEHVCKVWLRDGTVRDLVGHAEDVYCVDLNPGGGLCASGSEDQSVRVWDLATGRDWRVLRGHLGDVWGVSWYDESRLVSCSLDGTVLLWDVRANHPVWRSRVGEELWHVVSLPHDEAVAVTTLGGEVVVLAATDGAELGRRGVGAEQPRRLPLALISSESRGDNLVCGTEAGELWLWDYRADSWKAERLSEAPVKCVARLGPFIAFGTEDGRVGYCDRRFDHVKTWPAHSGHPSGLAGSSAGDLLWSCGVDGRIVEWDVAEERPMKELVTEDKGRGLHLDGLNIGGMSGLSPTVRSYLLNNGAVERRES
ncbi:MAG: NACHT domain-containing protein [bacterium]|nr:NACHT domain-containing protein [bacterium]